VFRGKLGIGGIVRRQKLFSRGSRDMRDCYERDCSKSCMIALNKS